jgi:hypothetical protein
MPHVLQLGGHSVSGFLAVLRAGESQMRFLASAIIKEVERRERPRKPKAKK